MYDTNIKDALGNKIVFGSTYGYSFSRGGVTTVKIGEALYFSEVGRVSMKVLSHQTARGNRDLQDVHEIDEKPISVQPALLFPVTNFK